MTKLVERYDRKGKLVKRRVGRRKMNLRTFWEKAVASGKELKPGIRKLSTHTIEQDGVKVPISIKQTATSRVVRRKGKLQVVGTDRLKDSKRKAMLPGWRISKSGNLYYENRVNRSDVNPTQKI